MNVLEAINNRTSCKNFIQDKRLDKETMEKIAKAGTRAATGMNKQSPIILAVNNTNLRNKLSKMNAEVLGSDVDPFYGAPQLFVVLAKKDVRTHVYDGSIVMANMMIAAESLGVGACWIHRAKEMFETDEGKQILKDAGIEGEYEGIGNLVVGYLNGEKKAAPQIKDNYITWIE